MMNMIWKMILTYILKNWRTTLVGVVGWALSTFGGAWLTQHGVSQEQLLAAIVGLVALFAKDGSVSGTPTTPTLPATVIQGAPDPSIGSTP